MMYLLAYLVLRFPSETHAYRIIQIHLTLPVQILLSLITYIIPFAIRISIQTLIYSEISVGTYLDTRLKTKYIDWSPRRPQRVLNELKSPIVHLTVQFIFTQAPLSIKFKT